MCGDPRRDPSFGTLEVSGHRGRASGEPREAGRDTHRGAETNDRDKSWEERDQREAGRGAKQGAGNQHALQVPRNILLLRDTPSCSLGCSETSLMQAAWLLGALVVPQLLGFSHGAQGAEREWEGGWGGAQEEEREREALMLKSFLMAPPAGLISKSNFSI